MESIQNQTSNRASIKKYCSHVAHVVVIIQAHPRPQSNFKTFSLSSYSEKIPWRRGWIEGLIKEQNDLLFWSNYHLSRISCLQRNNLVKCKSWWRGKSWSRGQSQVYSARSLFTRDKSQVRILLQDEKRLVIFLLKFCDMFICSLNKKVVEFMEKWNR